MICREKEVVNRKKLKNDMILIAVILAMIVAYAFFFLLSREAGDAVVVTVDGVLFGEYYLDEECTVEIRSGQGVNILVIEGGYAFVSHADCPDGICARHRPISYDGESIICLPHEVVITIVSQSENTPDIIA